MQYKVMLTTDAAFKQQEDASTAHEASACVYEDLLLERVRQISACV